MVATGVLELRGHSTYNRKYIVTLFESMKKLDSLLIQAKYEDGWLLPTYLIVLYGYLKYAAA